MNKLIIVFIALALCSCNSVFDEKKGVNSENNSKQQPVNNIAKAPIMGWASWNNYRVNINEDIIKSQADAMVSKGLKDVGYAYVNIDDGFFGGRDENGILLFHKERFPNGMKSLADYIHSKGLKAHGGFEVDITWRIKTL